MRTLKWIESNAPASMVDILIESGQMLGRTTKIQWLGQTYQDCVNAGMASTCDQMPPGDPAKADCIAAVESTCRQQYAPLSKSDVYAIQDQINAALKSAGLCPIGRDGKLGPQTCGAAGYVTQNIDGSVGVPAGCASVPYVEFNPKQCPTGGGAGGGGGGGIQCQSGFAPDASGKCVPIPVTPTVSKPSGGGWAIALLAALVLGVGVVAIART